MHITTPEPAQVLTPQPAAASVAAARGEVWKWYVCILLLLATSLNYIDRLALNLQAKRIMADVFRSKTRDEWCQLLEGTDACFAPVLSMREAPIHPQNQARRAFVAVGEVLQPAPAPRFSRTPLADPRPAAPASEYSDANLRAWGLECAEIARLAKSDPDGREP